MASWTWISRFEWQGLDLAEFPNVRDWYVRIAERPAVQKGYHVPKFVAEVPIREHANRSPGSGHGCSGQPAAIQIPCGNPRHLNRAIHRPLAG